MCRVTPTQEQREVLIELGGWSSCCALRRRRRRVDVGHAVGTSCWGLYRDNSISSKFMSFPNPQNVALFGNSVAYMII